MSNADEARGSPMLTVCCVNAGNYLGRGDEYIANLYWCIQLERPYRFVCFSDGDHPGIDGGYEQRPLPYPGLKGWMNKLALFKPGVFEEGERVFYLDLDTVIAGGLDDIAAYDGEFAMLEDFLFPQLRASGVMAWRGGFGAHIWESYAAAGFPQDVRFEGYTFGGDGAWIMKHAGRMDVLQDLYPNQFASYKASGGVLSPHTRLVCFHGSPRPHEVTSGWVPALWKGEATCR
jgi:hypothetical protein